MNALNGSVVRSSTGICCGVGMSAALFPSSSLSFAIAPPLSKRSTSGCTAILMASPSSSPIAICSGSASLTPFISSTGADASAKASKNSSSSLFVEMPESSILGVSFSFSAASSLFPTVSSVSVLWVDDSADSNPERPLSNSPKSSSVEAIAQIGYLCWSQGGIVSTEWGHCYCTCTMVTPISFSLLGKWKMAWPSKVWPSPLRRYLYLPTIPTILSERSGIVARSCARSLTKD